MKTSESIKNISIALLKSQKVMGVAKKEVENTYFHSKYADLGAVMEVCKELLNSNGILILQPIVGMNVETTLIHDSGEWMTSETPIVCVPNDPQKLGSAVTYARRYGLQSMLFIPSEDDDANAASNVAQKAASKPTVTQKVPPAPESEPVKTFGDCPDCGEPLIEKTKKDGSTYFRCSAGRWDSVNKKETGCPYVDWNNGTDLR